MTMGLPVPRHSRYILRPPMLTSPAKSGCAVGVTGGTVGCTCALLPQAMSVRNSAVAASDLQRNRLDECIEISKLWQKRSQKAAAIWANGPSVRSTALPGAVTQHIPDTGEHLIRYYGFYSNKESRVGGKSRDGDESWDEMAPPQVAEIIRQRGSSDYKK